MRLQRSEIEVERQARRDSNRVTPLSWDGQAILPHEGQCRGMSLRAGSQAWSAPYADGFPAPVAQGQRVGREGQAEGRHGWIARRELVPARSPLGQTALVAWLQASGAVPAVFGALQPGAKAPGDQLVHMGSPATTGRGCRVLRNLAKEHQSWGGFMRRSLHGIVRRAPSGHASGFAPAHGSSGA